MDNNVNNDAVVARRRALAEALRSGEPISESTNGQLESSSISDGCLPKATTNNLIEVPELGPPPGIKFERKRVQIQKI